MSSLSLGKNQIFQKEGSYFYFPSSHTKRGNLMFLSNARSWVMVVSNGSKSTPMGWGTLRVFPPGNKEAALLIF